jgi:hypothetical protein
MDDNAMKPKNFKFRKLRATVLVLSTTLASCASIDFDSGEQGLVYYEPQPYLFYSRTSNCVSSVTVVSVPGAKKRMDFSNGIGSSELSANFSNGVITGIGQANSAKVPEALTSVAELVGAMTEGKEGGCSPASLMYPIKDGKPNTADPINFLK